MATYATGTVKTTDLTVGVIIDIDPLIRMLTATENPLQSGVGSDGRTVLSSAPIFEKKCEWQDEELLEPVTAVNGTKTTGDEEVVVTANHRTRISTGDVLLVGGTEQVLVTGYNATAHTLDISRGYAGTSADTITDAADIVVLGANLAEGSDPENARATDWTNRFNYTQIFGPTAVQVSRTENRVRKYGLTTSMFDKQLANRSTEEMIKYEHALIYGIRYEDTTNARRQLGGINYYTTVNVDSSTTLITTTTLLDQVQACYEAGGAPDKLLVGPTQKRRISAWDSDDIRLGRMDNGRGQTVEFFDCDFGRIDFCLHRRVRLANAFLFSREQAEQKVFTPLQFEMLGKTGDSVKGMIVMEKSFKFEADRHAAKFTALT